MGKGSRQKGEDRYSQGRLQIVFMKTLALLAISGGLYTCQPHTHSNHQPQKDTSDKVTHHVPDAGSTLGFLTIGLASVLAFRRFKS
jgi:hypothetical protein